MKILTIDQMREAEQACVRAGVPLAQLMENAGLAVASAVRQFLGAVEDEHILVLIGPGNNGGDGLVAARHLHEWGARVHVYILSQRRPADSNLELVEQRGIPCVEADLDTALGQFEEWLAEARVVIDSLFGTGKVRHFTGVYRQVLERVNRVRKERPTLSIVAVDLPSGMNADTGAVDEVTPYADYTVTLGYPKLGLLNLPGAERAGNLTIAHIGIPSHLVEYVDIELITAGWAGSVLPGRPLQANKGTFGKVLVVAGSLNYVGAAYLACSGAIRSGAGLVTLATASSLQPVLAAKMTEVTYIPLPESPAGFISAQAVRIINEQLERYNVLLIGCGLGQNRSVTALLRALLLKSSLSLPPLVIDADALNTLATMPDWWHKITGDAILTPHPGEMARLAGISVDEIQRDRVGICRRMAGEWHKTVVLKGAYSVIAVPDGRCRVSPVANPGLASAGTGDVLAGAIAGLLAQGLAPFDAAALGVYVHGEAGNMVRDDLGDTGMIASDLLPALPKAIKRLRAV